MHFENLENSLWMYPVRIYIYSVVSVVHVCVCDVCLFETHVECRKLEGQNMAKLYRHLPIDVQRLRTRMQCSQVGSVQCPKQGSSLLQQAYWYEHWAKWSFGFKYFYQSELSQWPIATNWSLGPTHWIPLDARGRRGRSHKMSEALEVLRCVECCRKRCHSVFSCFVPWAGSPHTDLKTKAIGWKQLPAQ